MLTNIIYLFFGSIIGGVVLVLLTASKCNDCPYHPANDNTNCGC